MSARRLPDGTPVWPLGELRRDGRTGAQPSPITPPAPPKTSPTTGNTPAATARKWIARSHPNAGDAIPETSGFPALCTCGEGFLDIHLNATTRWNDVPDQAE